MDLRRLTRTALGVLLPVVALGVAVSSAIRPVHAETPDEAAKRERCATRLSIALLGKSPSAALLGSAVPQDSVDAMLADPAFIDGFARFANARFNPEPGDTSADDASYHLAKYILQNNKPWKDLFVGTYNVDASANVTVDPNGLGYFRSAPWMRRYAGNELAGYRIVGAYRILQNTTGLRLTAVTNVAGVDLSATGRQAAGCAGCHYSSWYALDKVARVLSRRQGTGASMTFVPPTDGPQQILGGQTISNDKELLTALVASENFKVNACRTAFNFVYGRDETTCEAYVFDACVDALAAKGTMQAAVAAIAKDPSFCQ